MAQCLFPLYSFVLKIVALGYLVPWLVVWIVLTVFVPSHRAADPMLTLAGGWASFCTNIIVIFGSVTLAFAILERVQSAVSALQQWDPRKLPRIARQRSCLARGIRLRSGLQHRLHRVVALTFALWTRDIWPYCGLFLAEPRSPRLVSSRARADVHYRVAAMRQPLASAVDLVSRRRSASCGFCRALYLRRGSKDPSLPDSSGSAEFRRATYSSARHVEPGAFVEHPVRHRRHLYRSDCSRLSNCPRAAAHVQRLAKWRGNASFANAVSCYGDKDVRTVRACCTLLRLPRQKIKAHYQQRGERG